MNTWKQELKQAFRSPETLLSYLDLDLPVSGIPSQTNAFKCLVPRPYANRIKKGKRDDPLLKQVLPDILENSNTANFVQDPLLENTYTPTSGLLHKYKNRILLITTGACAINCRYCFRRHFPYSDNRLDTTALKNAINYVLAHPEINEVILSGGDPLLLDDAALTHLFNCLSQLKQLKRIRIHTRLPIVIPSRVTPTFLGLIQQCAIPVVIVSHINHANEIDSEVAHMFSQLKACTNVTLLNQSVLLLGVNDNLDTLIELSECLFNQGILPYYLHLLDAVQGAAHFSVSKTHALKLYAKLQGALSGYLVPNLVQEIHGQPCKTRLSGLFDQ